MNKLIFAIIVLNLCLLWLLVEGGFAWLAFNILDQFLLVVVVLLVKETFILVLIIVRLRGAIWVDIKCLKLFACVFFFSDPLLLFFDRLLLFHLFLLFLWLFIVLLLSCEGLKYVLIVQQGMGELILEVCVLQELADALLDDGHLQDCVDWGASCWVLLQHDTNQLP